MFIAADDATALRQEVLIEGGYLRREQIIHHWWRDLEELVLKNLLATGFTNRLLAKGD